MNSQTTSRDNRSVSRIFISRMTWMFAGSFATLLVLYLAWPHLDLGKLPYPEALSPGKQVYAAETAEKSAKIISEFGRSSSDFQPDYDYRQDFSTKASDRSSDQFSADDNSDAELDRDLTLWAVSIRGDEPKGTLIAESISLSELAARYLYSSAPPSEAGSTAMPRSGLGFLLQEPPRPVLREIDADSPLPEPKDDPQVAALVEQFQEEFPIAVRDPSDRMLVFSPFGAQNPDGSIYQKIDITGYRPGSIKICPFSGKKFIVPLDDAMLPAPVPKAEPIPEDSDVGIPAPAVANSRHQ